jgi:phytoene/squalene synthetase
MFLEGRPLVTEATEKLRRELRLTWSGGMRILGKIEASGFDVLTRRPHLTSVDKLTILAKAILFRTV